MKKTVQHSRCGLARIQKILRQFVGFALCAGAVTTAWADRLVTRHLTLTEDTDWRGEGTVTLASNVVVNLNGHTLRVDSLVPQGTTAILNQVMPADYVPLESITSSGANQYISISREGQVPLTIRGEFSISDNGGNYVILGSESPKVIPLWISGSDWYVGYNSGNVQGSKFTGGTDRQLVYVRMQSGEQNVWANGVNVVHGEATGTFKNGHSLCLLARHANNYQKNCFAPATLYFMDIYLGEDATLERSLIPAQCVSDNKVGMYDEVNSVFYPSSGASPLSAGQVVSALGGTGGALFFKTKPGTFPLENCQRPHGLSIDVTVDVSDSGVVPGDCLFHWAEPPSDVVFHLEGGAAGVSLVALPDGLYYLGSDSVTRAVWTGAALDGNVANAQNWSCENAMGNPVADAVPDAQTEVWLPPTVAFDVPRDRPVAWGKMTGACALAADCDWRGLTVAAFDATIDLQCHDLTLSDLSQAGLMITDSSLPASYRRLESIASSGAQYIDTGVRASGNVRAEADVSFANGNTASPNYVLLGAKTGSNIGFNLMWVSGAKWYVAYGDNIGGTVDYVYGRRVHVATTLKNGLQTCDVDDDRVISETKSGDLDTGCNLTVFGRNFSNGSVGNLAYATLYAMKIWKDDALVCDFVPAQRVSDEEVGLFDLVSGTFFTKKGSGAFTAGTVTAEPVQPGELHLDVAAERSVENTGVTLTGSLRFVKEGDGAYVANKAGQSYFGGTEVSEGTLVYGTATYPVGPKSATVTIAADATLDMNGILDTTSCIYNYDLAGTVRQYAAGDGYSDSCRCFGDITLSGDATIVGKGYKFANPMKKPGLITFNGHALTFDIVDAQGAEGYCAFGPWRDEEVAGGTIEVLRGSFECDSYWGCQWTRLVVSSAATFKVKGGFDVGGLEYGSSSWVSNIGTPCLKVYGRYLAESMRPPLEMQKGSTLDLSAVDGVWSADGEAPTELKQNTTRYNKPGRVTFAANAEITVIPPNRSGKIVDWTGHAPDSSVTFRRTEGVDGCLIVKDDGLYFKRGMIIIFR